MARKGPAPQLDLARVGLQEAGHDRQQRRFPSAVRAQQAEDVALIYRERDAVQSGRRTIALGQVEHFENRTRHGPIVRRREGIKAGRALYGLNSVGLEPFCGFLF